MAKARPTPAETPAVSAPSIFGDTRTAVRARHAIITPDGHVASALPGADGVTPYYLISPAMGAALNQLRLVFDYRGSITLPASEWETALYVETGSVAIDDNTVLKSGAFAFRPAGSAVALHGAAAGTAVTLFQKRFEPLAGVDRPAAVTGHSSDVAGEPFLGNKRAILQTLLPTTFEYDLAINIFTYRPGATLPFVETHVMEHGLLMLSGEGIYRLEDAYYPVRAGDVIWMAPYCPQWFVAVGDKPASYLYYKNVNRLPK